MTTRERLQLLIDVANAERWTDRDDPDTGRALARAETALRALRTRAAKGLGIDTDEANALRASLLRAPLSRAQIKKKLHAFLAYETRIEVDLNHVGIDAREWRPRFRYVQADGADALRGDLTDHEREQVRLEELRVCLGVVLRGDADVLVTVATSGSEGEQRISGPLPDVVLYLAVRLLADSGLTVSRCEAPAAGEPSQPNAYDRLCGGVFVKERAQGRYCSDACKSRAYAAEKKKKEKEKKKKQAMLTRRRKEQPRQ
jgi:hypothetical protein